MDEFTRMPTKTKNVNSQGSVRSLVPSYRSAHKKTLKDYTILPPALSFKCLSERTKQLRLRLPIAFSFFFGFFGTEVLG